MEKEELKNFSIINNRGIDSPLNASCDNIIDKNGNIIYKNYNNLYKLTYKHIYKYKRITCISTDTIYDHNYNAYTPLYHYYYIDNGLNVNHTKALKEGDKTDEASNEKVEKVEKREDTEKVEKVEKREDTEKVEKVEKREDTEKVEKVENGGTCNEYTDECTDECIDEYVDENAYNIKSTKQKCLRYNLYELLLLRFLNYKTDEENDSNDILNHSFFIKENKYIRGGSNKYVRDGYNSNIHDNSFSYNSNNKGEIGVGHTNYNISNSSNNHYGNYDTGNNNNYIGSQNGNFNYTNNYNNNLRTKSGYNHDKFDIPNKHSNISLNNMNNYNSKAFKYIDDNCYNLPLNNIYIDMDGKMHLTEQERNNGSGYNSNMHYGNKYERNSHYQNKENDNYQYQSHYLQYSPAYERIDKNDPDKYWDNPLMYGKKNNQEIFTLGDIKKFSKKNERENDIRGSNYNKPNADIINENKKMNDDHFVSGRLKIGKEINENENNQGTHRNNSYAIFKDNDEENLAKSNFAKWFKNNHIDGKDNVDVIKYVNTKNKTGTEIGVRYSNNNPGGVPNHEGGEIYSRLPENTNNNNINYAYTNENMSNMNNTESKQLSNTVAELVMKQISLIKERNKNIEDIEKQNSLNMYENNWKNSNSFKNGSNIIGQAQDNNLYIKDGGKNIMDILKNLNSNKFSHESMEQEIIRRSTIGIGNEHYGFPINNDQYNYRNNNNNKQYSMDISNPKKKFYDNNINEVNKNNMSIDYMMMNKKIANNVGINNGHININDSPNLVSRNNYNSEYYLNHDNNINYNSYKNKNTPQGNINITPIINSLLRVENDNIYNDNSRTTVPHINKGDIGMGYSISENIQNAKVNNVLDSLKSLLKASQKDMDGNNIMGSHLGNLTHNLGNNRIYNNTSNFNQQKNPVQINKYTNYHSQQYYPTQYKQEYRHHQNLNYNDFNKKKIYKKDKHISKYSKSDIPTNESLTIPLTDEN
ncbi:conserved Plasmodium protein, unknown function [Plasmodium vinckei vinckei]|uniref:Uncharacterized protein n=1 Tax=Plasmodium vinckei vinckei TaxID=54757 RepID=A0A449BW90_PLAVN|nr:conserved Plasmodium protein, unknown function [Plasmodium vinckei vinckei]KEG03465.1 hypothetical protein YYE_01489 [Plasmodium vinckei vinckei]VEV57756.1 conserved Plasmodium protein, unknown function [Plasmodium vinckei vinckei]